MRMSGVPQWFTIVDSPALRCSRAPPQDQFRAERTQFIAAAARRDGRTFGFLFGKSLEASLKSWRFPKKNWRFPLIFPEKTIDHWRYPWTLQWVDCQALCRGHGCGWFHSVGSLRSEVCGSEGWRSVVTNFAETTENRVYPPVIKHGMLDATLCFLWFS